MRERWGLGVGGEGEGESDSIKQILFRMCHRSVSIPYMRVMYTAYFKAVDRRSNCF